MHPEVLRHNLQRRLSAQGEAAGVQRAGPPPEGKALHAPRSGDNNNNNNNNHHVSRDR